MIKRLKIIGLTAILAISTYGFTSYRNDFFEIAKQIEIFTNLYKEINMNYVDEVNPAELMNTAIEAMLEDLDPYTVYWNEQEIQNARIRNSGNYTGIGADIISLPEHILIKNIMKDSPADKAGMKIGDQIIRIGDVWVKDYKEDAGELLKGAANTKVEVELQRGKEQQRVILTRGVVNIKAVPYYKMLNNNTGYIVLAQFTRSASSEVIEAFQELKDKGATKIILDLRNNPGGLLSEAVNVSNIFIEKGTTITFTKSAIEKYNQTYTTQNKALDTEIPVAVLINENSASASEIVSGSLQDLDRGVVIGSRSYGKGLVQRPKKLNYGTQAKITISRYYTPSGRCIQALDYLDGQSIRKEQSEYAEFKTKNGRTVYDGGGIKPDISIGVEQDSDYIKALNEDNIIFNFVNIYLEDKSMSLESFELKPEIMANLKSYIDKSDFEFKTETDKKIDELKQMAKQENYSVALENAIQTLEEKLKEDKIKVFDRNKASIEKRLTELILRKLGYDEAVYNYYTEKGEVIKEAIHTLDNTNKYNQILGYK
jgi:carboxyl-terminal processing protease